MTSNIVVVHYVVYILISAVLTVWVGKTLFKNGRIFLVDSFDRNEPMVDSVNHLITVGFYLITFGIVSLFLRYGAKPESVVDSIEFMSSKVGGVLLLLVLMHFLNVFGIAKMRNRSLEKGEHNTPGAGKATGTKEFKPEQFLRRLEVSSHFDSDSQDLMHPTTNSTKR